MQISSTVQHSFIPSNYMYSGHNTLHRPKLNFRPLGPIAHMFCLGLEQGFFRYGPGLLGPIFPKNIIQI